MVHCIRNLAYGHLLGILRHHQHGRLYQKIIGYRSSARTVSSVVDDASAAAPKSRSLYSLFANPKQNIKHLPSSLEHPPKSEAGGARKGKKISLLMHSRSAKPPGRKELHEKLDSKSPNLRAILAKPKPRDKHLAFGAQDPSLSDADGTSVRSFDSPRFQPMEEKEFPKELAPEAAALVSRLQECGYLKEGNFSKEMLLGVKEIPATLYSRHFFKAAAEKFGQDHQEIAKWLSGSDLKEVALFGCPTVERRTVFAAKRLRAFFKIQEDIICRGCKIKTSCKFMNQRVGRVEKVILSDTMRVITLFAFEAVPKQLHIPNNVTSSVCKLLKEVLNLSQ